MKKEIFAAGLSFFRLCPEGVCLSPVPRGVCFSWTSCSFFSLFSSRASCSSWCKILVFLFAFQFALVPTAFADLQNDLTTAFSRAFADPVFFRATGLFEKLGYSSDQAKQMVEVTPRPASLTVEFVQSLKSQAFERLRVTAYKVRYYNLTIDHATFDFPNSELDFQALAGGNLVFKKADSVGIETNVSEGDILKVFNLFAKARSLSQLKMNISEKETVLTGKAKKGTLAATFSVQGNPVLDGNKKIRFNCRRMMLNGLIMPRSAINLIFNKINPVFDAGKTWLNLDLQRIATEKGYVHSWGVIRPPQAKLGKGG